MAKKRRKDKPSLFGRILGGIERAGNRLPHPITLFALFTLGIILVSALCALLGVSATGNSSTPKPWSWRPRPSQPFPC